MRADEIAETLERLRDRVGDFHRALAIAHHRAAARALEQAARELRWLAALSWDVAGDAWEHTLTALGEAALGLASASGSLAPENLNLSSLGARARGYWSGGAFPEAAADLLTREGSRPEDLEALARALALFLEELDRATGGSASAPGGPPTGRPSGSA